MTRGNVNVSATFSDDSVLKEYSFDGKSWLVYTGPIEFADNGFVLFCGTDAAGNASEVVSYSVTNIDRVPPMEPVLFVDITAETNQDVTITPVFSPDTVGKEYSLDGQTWQTYTDPIVFEENGEAYFRATDAAGNVSEVTGYTVANIDKTTPEGAPDDGWNNDGLNDEVFYTSATPIGYGVSSVLLDMENTVSLDGKHNFVGTDDMIDYTKIYLMYSTQLSFTVTSIDAAKFTIYKLVTSKNGDYSLKKIQTTELKKAKDATEYTATTNRLLLDSDEYFISVQSTNTKKGKVVAYYNVAINDNATVYFSEGDNTDDWTDVKTMGVDGEVGNAGVLNEFSTQVVEDWVGYGDAIDYKLFTLESAAKLCFVVSSTDAAKFTIWKINEKSGKNGTTYSLKSLQNATTVAKDATVETKSLLIEEAGTYAISMQSTNAAKGGNAFYTVDLAESSVFFTDADNSDDWTTLSTDGFQGDVGDIGMIDEFSPDRLVTDWVGCSDDIDYKMFSLETPAKLGFTLSATDAAKFTVWKLVEKTDKNGKVTYSLKSLQTATTIAKGATVTTSPVLFEEAGTYVFSMQSTNAAKGGSAYYTVDLDKTNVQFFSNGDHSDDWTSLKADGAEGDVGDVGTLDQSSGFIVEDWVGCGDSIDYKLFTVTGASKLSFTLTATDAVKFLVYEIKSTKSGKKVTYSLKTLQTTTLKPGSADSATIDTKVLTLKKGGTYAFSMESINAAKGGDAYYTVAVNQGESTLPAAAQNADALFALPETSVSLDLANASGSMEDSLNFGQIATSDVIAAGATSGLLDDASKLDDKAAWQNIAKLA